MAPAGATGRRVAEIFASLDCGYLERVPAAGSPDEVEAAVRARVEQET